MEIKFILILMWLHLIGDFVLQSNWMAINKSRDISALLIHSLVYGIVFLPISNILAACMFLSHGLVDGISSLITSHFWKKEKRYGFFVTIGIDQAIHLTILILLFQLFNN